MAHIEKLPLFVKCVIQNFPFIEEDFDSLTNYELLCKVVEYLNKVISSQNEVIGVANNLQDAFQQLHDYVENYFDNLDVQEEINNKLDEMAEDGTLQEIITAYIQANVAWCFNTVADMKAATNLINGSYAQTLGYSSINDGGKAIYRIVDTADSNEFQETLNSGLYATLIGALSPENTGLSVDSLINNWNTKKELEFGKEKSYVTTSTITIRDVKTYDFNGSTITYDGDSVVEDVINIGYSHNTPGVIIRLYAGIKNLNINCNSKARNGLHISGGKALQFENIRIQNPLNYGLLADNSVGQNWELNLNNIQAAANNATGQGLAAIKITDVTDSNFTNIYPINGSDCWMYSKTNWCTFTNIHGYKFPDTDDYIQTQAFNVYGDRNAFDHIIIDTADAIGIVNNGQFNVFTDVNLGVKAGGIGIKNIGGQSTYENIVARKALAKIIDTPTKVAYLKVSGIATAKDTVANSYPLIDLEFDDNKLPVRFIYDYSAKVVTPLKSSLEFLKTITAPDTSVTIDLPYTMENNNYFCDVIMRNKAIPFSVTRSTTQVTVNINAADLPSSSVTLSVYVRPNE